MGKMGVRFTCLKKGFRQKSNTIISKGGKKETRKEKKSTESVSEV